MNPSNSPSISKKLQETEQSTDESADKVDIGKESKSNRMSRIENLKSYDPFADASKGDAGDYVHIRIQQRNGRKTLTTVQGISDSYDKKKLVKAFKKNFACNGTVIEHPEYGEVIQVQGDQRKNISQFITTCGLIPEEHVKVHGF
ncbi:Eukaryotic translation initiation factor 1b [Solea senegalensis]|uniref:Eukaryotic translation initiation factor 1b n=1 Tax=Solea senegalensis TaxID=28829 RepID=A0AAV6RK16_SOLSE|nr:eukaryotic translation initiation factor 1-like [Solea senegalensis]KAG7505763.1 Eukaryotic translation initiation factor 1b [Solea senegalensis]